MNPSQLYATLVTAICRTENRDYATTFLQVAPHRHPDLYTIMRAAGATRQKVEMFNERLKARAGEPDRKTAGADFCNAVEQYMKGHKSADYDFAFRRCQSLHPELWSRVCAKPARATFTNEAPASGYPPVASPQNLALLHLPASARAAEFEAAWIANGRQLSTLNPGKVFDAMAKWIQGQKAIEYEPALESARARYPDLWAMVEAIAKENE